MRKRTNEILKDILCNHSGEWMLAREITYSCRDFNRSINPKAVGKRMLELEDNGLAERKYHDNMETRAIGARYSYRWIGWKLGTGQSGTSTIQQSWGSEGVNLSGSFIG